MAIETLTPGWNALQADDGHGLQAWFEPAHAKALGSVVVAQEIFGVNAHIRGVCARLAQSGWHAIAPCLFDRSERGVELDYAPEDLARGRSLALPLGFDLPVLDLAAAANAMRRQFPDLAVGALGFCWGGALAWRCATQLAFPAVSYYGTRTLPFVHEMLNAPVLMHFGAHDALLPDELIPTLRAAHPEVPIELYDAGHGFNCDARPDYQEAAATLAWSRSMDFFTQHLSPHD